MGLSGGVDSAVAAYLLKRSGFDVVGIFMKNWEEEPPAAGAGDPHCASAVDFVDAAAVADVLGIEIEHVNFAAEYKDRVFAEFLHQYQAGRTPNPDVLCNAEIKFKSFLDHAMRLGADKIATGHYARVRMQAGSGRYQLLKGLDASKDQSYFLHRLNQAQLSRTLFPLGDMRKTEVRRIAAEIGLPNAAKKDSTGICFIGERPFREFLNRYIPANPGDICTPDGACVGRHTGLMFYTLGQRQGLGIGGTRLGDGDAWYVAEKDMAHNRLVVVQGHDHVRLFADRVTAVNLSWVSGATPPCGWVYGAKTRYRQKDGPCVVASATKLSCAIEFAEPQWSVTPGQSVVVYESNVCLGGGIIESTALTSAAAEAILLRQQTHA